MPKAIFDKNNILVVGGAGFIGSHLCEELLENNKVICIDNFISGSQDNIANLLKNPDFIFVRHNIVEPINLEEIEELKRFDIEFQGVQEVYNLAVPMNPKDFEKVMMETLLTNLYGTKNSLDIALKYKARFLQASSSVVYGARVEGMLFEEDYVGALDQFSPRSNYDLGKKMAESIVFYYNQIHQLDARIVRIFRTYGPRTPIRKGHMIPDFIVNALKGEDLVVYGDENFETSLVYVTDVVDGIIKVLRAPKNEGPVNIGSDLKVRLVDVCDKIIKKTGSKSQIRFEPSLMFMTELGLPDITKARKNMGWLPIVTLDKGLERTIEYAKAHDVLLGIDK